MDTGSPDLHPARDATDRIDEKPGGGNEMRFIKTLFPMLILMLVVMTAGTGYAQVKEGQQVPLFSLKDMEGKTYDLSTMKNKRMMIIYFFDATSRPSQETLLTMDNLAKKYKNADLTVWGVTCSSRDSVADFVRKTQPSFPILLDNAGVSDTYQARFILPTSCIIGPNLTMLNYFSGGGKATNVMLVKLAERKLQQKQTLIAQAISDEVIKKDPNNAKAKMIKGYAELKAGELDKAQNTFTSMTKEEGQTEILGKEGLAGVYAAKGQQDKALKLAQEVEKAAPDRAYVHTIKGDILYAQNNKTQAQAEYARAVAKPGAEDFQKAGAYNKLGRLYASIGEYKQSQDLYDQALKVDPYYVEAMANKGLTYEKEGKWDEALNLYNKGQSIDQGDIYAAALAKRASEMISLQKDSQNRERVDKLVKELAERYRSPKGISAKAPEDTWTSRPMILTFVDFQESGTLSDRDGQSIVLTTQLADELNASGRVKVVDRVVIERLLEELDIGSSDLADPQTALHLGKVLSARILGTGSLLHMPEGTLLSMRLIDTETTAIAKVINRELDSDASLKKDLHRLNREILSTIMTGYPLKAYVVTVNGKTAMINLGSNQGVVTGSRFSVIEEQAPVEYKGKKLQALPKSVAGLEVISVEPDLSHCKIIDQTRPVKTDDKAVEKIDHTLTQG